ncbi:MAG: Nudix family hydrolase [Pseudomonadales bacterium]|nr:Nudix family hydrolase [Pseudomonadales bacterium]
MPLQVAVAAIRDSHNRILISKRADHLHQGGLWEFPGGKIEAGESVKEALVREIREELGIEVTDGSPLISIPYQYSDRTVHLHVWLVDQFRGEPKGMEGQKVRWIAQEKLQEYDFPAANRSIISALQLPDQYLITPQKQTTSELINYLEAPIAKGIKLIQFRAPSWNDQQYLAAAPTVLEYCHSKGVQCVLNRDPELLAAADADGIHLNRHHLSRFNERPIGQEKWLSASCHNVQEIEQAQRIGVDYISLSPVLRTDTHPDAMPMGWQCFSELVASCSMPVFALGGMGEPDIKHAKAAGAQGIAGIRLFLLALE